MRSSPERRVNRGARAVLTAKGNSAYTATAWCKRSAGVQERWRSDEGSSRNLGALVLSSWKKTLRAALKK